MRVYIAGPMTGLPNYNFDLFNEVSKGLGMMGHEVYNPATTFGGRQDLPYDAYLREAVRLVSMVDAIVLLPGWEKSHGALTEVHVGIACNHLFFLWTDEGFLQPLRMSYELLTHRMSNKYVTGVSRDYTLVG